MKRKPPEPEAVHSARDIARRIQFMTGLVRKGLRQRATGDIMRAARDGSGPLADGAAADASVKGAGKGPSGPVLPMADQVDFPPARQPVAPKPAADKGWWVLAQGRILDPDDFGARELARQDLLDEVLGAGVFLEEYVWVWDETGRAQLVLATLPTQDRAAKVAERLRLKGLAVAVRREMP